MPPSSGETTTSSTTSEVTCSGADVLLPDGRCQPPGLPLDMPCPPGETPLQDGSCQAPGVPPSECGDGFQPDGGGGCEAILPEEPCPDGSMAIPGETECHPVSPCGAGTWGDIPVEPDTQFVDGSYAGADSDGTQQKPWKTVQQAVDAAAENAIVAVAAGTYAEDVDVGLVPVRLWGVCPSAVTLQGVSATGAVLGIFKSGTEVHAVAITGPALGVFTDAKVEALLEHVWIHDTGHEGAVGLARSSVTIRGSLIERATDDCAEAAGGALTVEGSSFRDSGPGSLKRGILVDGFEYGGSAPAVTVRDSLLEEIYLDAVNVTDGAVTLERVAIRSMRPDIPADFAPRGGLLTASCDVLVRQSTFEGMPMGIFLSGSLATVEHVTITDGEPALPQYKPLRAGIYVQEDILTKDPGVLTLRASTIARQPENGVGIDDGSATIESTLFTGNVTEDEGAAIRGVYANLTLRQSAIVDTRHSGISMEGSAVVVESSRVSGVSPTTHAGNGITIRGFVKDLKIDASLTLRSSLVEDCYEVGVPSIDASVVIESSIVRDVKARTSDGLFGDAFAVLSGPEGRGHATLTGSRFEGAARAGIAAFGSTVNLGSTLSQCATFPLAGEELMGTPFLYNKTADNACGCPLAEELCEIQSPGLAPPGVD